MDPRRPVYEPTPEQIREATEKLQATWSYKERRRRAGFGDWVEYEIPEVVIIGQKTKKVIGNGT